MPGPLPTFESGDPADKALNAVFLNSVVDRLRETEGTDRPADPSLFRSSIIANAYNATDTTIDVHASAAALSVSLNLLTDLDKLAFQKRPLLSLGVPTSPNSVPAITLAPIASGQIGRVVIGGLAVCTVDVIDETDTHANPTTGTVQYLTSSSSGQIRILWKDSGTGPKTAVVLLIGCCEDIIDLDGSGSGGQAGSGGDLSTVTIGPYLTDVSIECVTGSGGQPQLVLTKTYGVSIVTGVDLSILQQVYVPPSGGA